MRAAEQIIIFGKNQLMVPSFVPVASGVAASIFADFTTQNTTKQYWSTAGQSAGLTAWIAAMGGSIARASSANFFQAGLMVTAGSGVMRFPTTSGGTPTGLRVTPLQTELLLFNRDLTNAAWVKTTMTVAKDQAGIDGIASAASSLTATGANATVLQTLTRGSAARLSGCWVKRITGSGAIQMTQDNGTTWTAITVAGAYSQVASFIPVATAANPVVGFRIVVNGDAIAVDCVAHREMGSGTNGIPDPIPTTTVVVTQAADRILFPYSAQSGACLTYTQNLIYPGIFGAILGADTSSGIFNGIFDSTHFATYNGGTATAQPGTATLANLNKCMTTGPTPGVTNQRKICVNNGTVGLTSVAYAGGAFANAVLGGTATVANNMVGDIGRLALWPNLVATAADLGTLTT